jgi:DNA-binding transcriptional MerR regulator
VIAELDVELLTNGEVAAQFNVVSQTVTRWANSGLLLTVRTRGGQHRFFAIEVEAILRGESRERARELALAEKARLSGGASP